MTDAQLLLNSIPKPSSLKIKITKKSMQINSRQIIDETAKKLIKHQDAKLTAQTHPKVTSENQSVINNISF